MPTEFMTVSDVALEFNFPKPTVYTWVRERKIDSYRRGYSIYLKRSDVENFLAIKHIPAASGAPAVLAS